MSIMALPGEDWSGEDFPGLFSCLVCGIHYPTEREADLCTPAYLIPARYGMDSVTPEVLVGIPDGWLD